jgi:hypothetical protein
LPAGCRSRRIQCLECDAFPETLGGCGTVEVHRTCELV